MPRDHAETAAVRRAGVGEIAAVLGGVILPTMAKGPLLRRRAMVGLVDRLDLDTRAVRRLAALRDRHGGAMLALGLPGKTQVVVLDHGDARRILVDEAGEFTPATDAKRAALAHFEPRISLASRGADRRLRRDFNEAVLEHDRPVHAMAGPLLAATEAGIGRLVAEAGERLDYPRAKAAWDALTRRLVLGEGARGDTGLMDLLDDLRGAANWAFLHPGSARKLDRFRARIEGHLTRAEPGSLAARVAATPQAAATAPADQVAHYLFGWDGAGMTLLRALAVLASLPEALERARADAAADPARTGLPYLRAVVLETLRLWPTTPLIFRQATRPVQVGGTTLPEGTAFTLYLPFFHRDPALPDADRFAPERWLAEDRGPRPLPPGPAAFVPFSLGGGRCPASELVAMVTAAALAGVVTRRTPVLDGAPRLEGDRMPGTLDHFGLAFRLAPA